MVNPLILFQSVLLLFLMMIPGFLLRKSKIAGDSLPKDLSNLILYVAQPAMIIDAFVRDFDKEVAFNAAGVLVFSFVAHALFYLIAKFLFRSAPHGIAKIYRFGVIFSNAGYMGIPLIKAIFDDSAAIYASVYIIAFNFFTWSLGCLIYSEDKSYISPRKMFVNPATIPIYIGILIFLLPINQYIPTVVCDALSKFSGVVAPLSMMLIGMLLADVKLKGAFSDRWLWEALAVRLLVFPALIWGVVRLFSLTGLYHSDIATAVTLICAATPSAAATGMFATKFGCDTQTASKFVSVSTIFSVLTMPVIALLLKI
ncbi:MAG: AEC family transporter [Eubacteriales bacterium]